MSTPTTETTGEAPKKLCFVIMGFGKKRDPETNRIIDLDATYTKIIQPAVIASGCHCIRADEIIDSALIDKSMYYLLYKADVVIADITTLNANALYELGVRHAIKKHATIIIKESNLNIPFDIGHCRMLNYSILGNCISRSEALAKQDELQYHIEKILSKPQPDSPLYTYLPEMTPPNLNSELMEVLNRCLQKKEENIYDLTSQAKMYMQQSEFSLAATIWEKLSHKVANEKYYIQQWAICRYKSNSPSELAAYMDALTIIDKIRNQADSETLGIKGAICKRIFLLTNDISFLDRALILYRRSWYMFSDYYTGENYANCLFIKSKRGVSDEDMQFYGQASLKVWGEVITAAISAMKDEDSDTPKAHMWIHATISNGCRALGEQEAALAHERHFYEQNPSAWQIKTFEETKSLYTN